jgi:hypothetical protein
MGGDFLMNKISLFKYIIAAMFCLNSAFAMELGQAQKPQTDEIKISIEPKAKASANTQNNSLFNRAVAKVTAVFQASVNFVKNNPNASILIAETTIGIVMLVNWYFHRTPATTTASKRAPINPENNLDDDDDFVYTVKDSDGCPGSPAFGKCLTQIKQEKKTACEKWNFTDSTNNKICLPSNPKKEDCLSPQDFCKLVRAKDEISTKCYPDGEKNNLTFNQLNMLKNGYCSSDKFAQASTAEIFQKAKNWCKQGNNAAQTVQKFNQSICRYLEKASKESGVGSSSNKYKKLSEPYGCDYLDKCYPKLRNNK